MEETKGNFASGEILSGLENIIQQKVRSRETRASINAMAFMPVKGSQAPFKEFGLEINAPATSLQPDHVSEAIDECNLSIQKLLLIADHLGMVNVEIIKTLLASNTFDTMSLSEISKILSHKI